MESEARRTQRHKRREREHQLQLEKCTSEGDSEDDIVDGSPSKIRERGRYKPRKKRSPLATYEEDIIDGFAICSFRTIDDLEKYANGKLHSLKKYVPKEKSNTLSYRSRHQPNSAKRRDRKTHNSNSIPNVRKAEESGTSDSGGETTDQFDGDHPVKNRVPRRRPKRSTSRERSSDVSTHSSSGRGYLCDSESGDERASDASSDIFLAAPKSLSLSRDCLLPTSTAATSCNNITLSGACTAVTSTTSDITATTNTTTTSSVLLGSPVTTNTTSTTTSTSICSKVHHNSSSINNNTTTNNNNHNTIQEPQSLSRTSPLPIKKKPHSTPPLPKSATQTPKTQGTPLVASNIRPSSRPNSSHRESHKTTPPPSRGTSSSKREDSSRERERDREHQSLPPSLSITKPYYFPSHSHSVVTNLYSPHIPRSPGLNNPHLSLHSTASHTPPFGTGSTIPLHPPPPHPQHNSHTMFAPPLPPGPPAGPLASSALGIPPSHLTGESLISAPDMLREELNRRFLASAERAGSLERPGYFQTSPYIRAEMHQHMHQHQHNHTHQHTYHGGLPIPYSSSLVPTPAPHVFDKLPNSPFYRQNPLSGLQGYPTVSPLRHPSGQGIPSPLNSGIPGAFQPKSLSSLQHHPSNQLMLPLRDRDKSASTLTHPTSLTGSSVPHTSLPPQKKSGKWCAAHVKLAWDIYHYQQKQADPHKGGSTEHKPLDPLRPPSHLLSGSNMSRPTDLGPSVSSGILGATRNPFDGSPHSLLSSSHMAPTFPRPSPYVVGTGLNLGGIGNGLPPVSREIPTISGSHEWSRLHRTPPTFSATPSRDRERELEKERDLSSDRRREDDRDRERRLSERERLNSFDSMGRDRERIRDKDHRSRSRSRSRSPIRNGRADSAKLEFDRRFEDKNSITIKEERRDEDILKNDIFSHSLRSGMTAGMQDPYLHLNSLSTNMMERSRLLSGSTASVFGSDRVPPPHHLWPPFDKGSLEFSNHNSRLLQRDMEARELLNRFPPQHPFPMFDHDRFKDEMFIREQERQKREWLERLPLFERERFNAAYFENKLPTSMRTHDPLGMSGLGHFGTISPALNHHAKGSSPAVIPGGPPPLIPSVSATQTSGHGSSTVNKTKGVSPTDSVGESKRDSHSNSTDPDAHSR